MAFGQPDDDDEIPDYHPFLMAAAGAAPADNGQAAQQGQPATIAVPQYNPVPQEAAAPQQTQVPQTAPAPSSAQPASPAVVLPTAPEAPQADLARYQALEGQLHTDQAPQKVAPKWWERLAGAAVGFGTGYGSGAEAGIRAGSAVTNRGQIAADADQGKKIAADESALSQFRTEADMTSKAYEDQIRGFDAKMQGATAQQGQNNADRSFNLTKTNEDRNFGRETANDTFNHNDADRNFMERQKQDNAANSRETASQAETARHNRTEEGFRGRELNDSEAKPAAEKDTTVAPAEWQKLLSDRDKEYTDAQGKMDDEMSTATTPAAKDAVRAKYAGLASQMQNTWNARLSTADPKGRYAQQNGGGAPAAAAPAAAAPAAAAAATPAPVKYDPLPPDKVRIKMPDGSVKVGPRANLAKAQKLGAVELK